MYHFHLFLKSNLALNEKYPFPISEYILPFLPSRGRHRPTGQSCGVLLAQLSGGADSCRDLLEALEHVGLLGLVTIELELLDETQLPGLAGGLLVDPDRSAKVPRGECQVCMPQSARPCVDPMRRG